ncbi:MAG TPA: M64 family metallopeptidase [Rhodanobacteraceae bacterium]|nr:M64 family metallopeptidase [Rhodanobacteraceae bacterium]
MRNVQEAGHASAGASPPLRGKTSASTADEVWHSVSGRVMDGGTPLPFATVLARDGSGRFVQSIGTDGAGNYTLQLAAGSYTLEAIAISDSLYPLDLPSGTWAWRSGVTSPVVNVSGDTSVADLTLPAANGVLQFHASLPYWPIDASAYPWYTHDQFPLYAELTTPAGTRRRLLLTPSPATPTCNDFLGLCDTVYELRLSPGTYASVALTPMGWPRYELGSVQISNGQQAVFNYAFDASSRTALWTSTLRNPDQSLALEGNIAVYDDAEQFVYFTIPDENGQFRIPWRQGWTYSAIGEITFANDKVPARHTFGVSAPTGDVVLGALSTPVANEGSELIRLHGDGNRNSRINIVLLADGFTNVAETYQDINGNGQWDGVQWIDGNLDGVYNSSSDYVALYGNAADPEEGSVPGADNEPFTDLNGDGVLSEDDHAAFLHSATVQLNALMNADFYRDNPDAFNVYALYRPSAQVGPTVLDASDDVMTPRDTRYDSYWGYAHPLLSVDTALATSDALAAVPQADVVVVLVNEAVAVGRMNALIPGDAPPVVTLQGGPNVGIINNRTLAHELGHALALLCDEYADFPTLHPLHDQQPDNGVAAVCPNSSHFPVIGSIPWADFLDPGTMAPSLGNDASLGIYIGSDYYAHGAYRPSFASIMGTGFLFFNAPSRAALQAVVDERADHIFDDGFEASGSTTD